MANDSITSFTPALKQIYTKDAVQNLVYKSNPFFAMVPKFEDFGGLNLPIPLIYSDPMGRSSVFATAQTNKTAMGLKAFTLTRKSDYALASIDNELLQAAKNDKGTFLLQAKATIDGAIHALSRSIATSLFRSGGGAIGQVANSSFATTVCTLTNAQDAVNFEVGMVLQANDTNDATSIRSGTLTVASIDRSAGTVTMSANLSTGIAAIAQNDFLAVQGDFGAKISGLEAWVPYTAPGATAFFGVDRTTDITRLAGQRVDGSALPIEEALVQLSTQIAQEGGSPDVCFMNYKNYRDLINALGSKVMYADMKVTPEVGFRYVMIDGANGPIKVVPDQNCPVNFSWMLELATWKLYSLGAAPHIQNSDGVGPILRESSSDSYETRISFYGNLGCNAPGFNGVVKLA